MRTLNWATLGCGVIANQLEQALESEGRKLYSVANRTHANGVAFAQKYGIGTVYDNIDDVFTDPNVDVIYISPPPQHAHQLPAQGTQCGQACPVREVHHAEQRRTQ